MASFGHVAVGLAAGRFHAGDGPRLRSMLVLSALAMFPDVDGVVASWVGVERHSVWLHRGALHSLAAAAVAAALGVLLLDRRRGGVAAFLVCLAAAASHGLLDTITHGGRGVMLLWPFTQARFLAPWHPLPASPMGLRILSARGLELVVGEALAFSPLLLYALWPRRDTPPAAAERSNGGSLAR